MVVLRHFQTGLLIYIYILLFVLEIVVLQVFEISHLKACCDGNLIQSYSLK